MAKGCCSKCKCVFSPENSSPAAFKIGSGYCRKCNNDWKNHKYESDAEFRERTRARTRKRWASASLEQKKARIRRHRFYRYGITPKDFNDQLLKQANRCSREDRNGTTGRQDDGLL